MTDPSPAWHSLVTDHTRMVFFLARRMRRLGCYRRLDHDDAIGAGFLGLVKAARAFDPTRGHKFSTWAWHAIRRAISAAARHTGPVSLPPWNSKSAADPRCRRGRTGASLDAALESGFEPVARDPEEEDNPALEKMREAIRNLPPKQRTTLILQLCGFRAKVTAAAAGTSTFALAELRRAAREAIQKTMGG